jgi:putative hemolysin
MTELPTPTLPLSAIELPRGALHPRHGALDQVLRNAPLPGTYEVVWARHLDEVRQAQRLRYAVFSGEMGAKLDGALNVQHPGHDIDVFDDYCEHLLVRQSSTGLVVGTYRLLTPAQARRAGGFYADTEFDLIRLRGLRSQMVELGRSCVHPDHRSGSVILTLWSALAQFMCQNGLQTMVGCASIPMNASQGTFGSPADMAASVWARLKEKHLAGVDLHVRPRLPLPLERLRSDLDVEPPALIKGYLRLGAKLLGAPAWDPDFNTADLPILMRMDDLPERYRKHFSAGLAG